MGRKLNLNHLSEEECEHILKVIQKDFDLRQLEKERLACIQTKVQEEDARMNILATRHDFNQKYCLICFRKFLFFFVPKTQCAVCKHFLCKNCILFNDQLKTDICLVCNKYHQLLLQSNSWFYKSIGEKFKRFGSAKVVRSLYKRRTDSDAEDDSGYHPSFRTNILSESIGKRARPGLSKVFEKDEVERNPTSGEEGPVRTLSFYREKLEAVERQITKMFIDSKGSRQRGRTSEYNEWMTQQAFNIALLLSSMTNDLTSQLNEAADLNQNSVNESRVSSKSVDGMMKETIAKCVLEQCITHVYPLSVSTDEDHPFKIDPEDLTLRIYIQLLSEAIVSKINTDLQSSEDRIFQQEEEDVKKELLKLSNRARMSQIGKQLSDSEMEDFPITTDSLSLNASDVDADGRESQTRILADSLSADSSLQRAPQNHMCFDDSEYDVDENSILAFASRKKGFISLPTFDSKSPTRQGDIDLEVTARAMPLSEDPWTLSERGPIAVMNNRIPIAPYDDYGKKKVEDDADVKMFLPKRHSSIEGPTIDSINVYELSDLSDASINSAFEDDDEDNLQHMVTPQESKTHKASENLQETQDSNHRQSAKPQFTTLPEDVTVVYSESFSCSCKLDGTKPIDVFWYRDGEELVQLGPDERCTVTAQGSMYTMTMDNCQPSDSGIYLCIAVNEHGSCQHRFSVTMQDENDHMEIHRNLPRINTVSSETNKVNEDAIGKIPDKNQQPNLYTSHSLRKGPEHHDIEVSEKLGTKHIENRNEQSVATFSIAKEPTKGDTEFNLSYVDPLQSENNNDPSKNEERYLLSDLHESLKKSNDGESRTFSQRLSDKGQANESQSLMKNEEYIGQATSTQLTETSYRTSANRIKPNEGQRNLNEAGIREAAGQTLSIEASINTSQNGDNMEDSHYLQKNHELFKNKYGHDAGTAFGPFMTETEKTQLPDSKWLSRIEPEFAGTTVEGLQDSVIVNSSVPEVHPSRYSRDYEVSNRGRGSESKNNGPTDSEKRLSYYSRFSRSNRSSTSESDVFELDTPQSVKAASINPDPPTPQSPKKSDFEELRLPSVKLLRLKFSEPPLPPTRDSSLRRRPNSLTKPETEPELISVDHHKKSLVPANIPLSVIPLQPAPINSQTVSPHLTQADTGLSSQSKQDVKFQKEVIIRPYAMKQYQKDKEKPNQRIGENAVSLAGRVSVQPFSQSSFSRSRETQARQKYPE